MLILALSWTSPRIGREDLDAPESGAFDDAFLSFNVCSSKPASADSAAMSTNGAAVTKAKSAQLERSNIQAGTSSHRSASHPLSVQRKTTPPALSIAS
jgi:hypothetical protein